jgi:PAS domain S-box-containing protein
MGRQRADAALREGERRFRIALQHAPIVVFNQDRDLRYTWVYNPAAMLGNETVIGRTDAELLPADDAARLTRIKRAVLESGKGARGEVRVTLHGQTLFFDMTVEPLRDSAGAVMGITCAASDVTERRHAEQRLAASLKERDALLKEVHHRVKNNLQVVCSLLDLQQAYVRDTDAARMFKDSQNRIRSIALVHEQLYRSGSRARIDFSEHIRTVVSHLFRTYGASPDRVSLAIVAEDIVIGIDTAILCGLIVGELVSNSLLHAFPDGAQGRVEVVAKKTGEDRLRLVVRDDGVSLPSHVDFSKPATLGLQLVHLLSEQLGAQIAVERAGGTTVSLVFPAS